MNIVVAYYVALVCPLKRVDAHIFKIRKKFWPEPGV